MATVFIPAALRRLTGGADRASARGTTVRELVDDLAARFPELRAALVRDGELPPHLAVSVDDVIASAGLDEPVGETSEVHFVPPLGGG